MRYLINYLLIIFVILVFTGCSIAEKVVGEYYLKQNKYEQGFQHFQEKLNKNNNDASNHYYYARFLLAKQKNKKALTHFKKAISLDNTNSNYFSWLGVSYSTMKQYKKEKESYLQALNLNKNNLQALTYLAHNYYDSKEYKKALDYYFRVIKIEPFNKSALYNRALCLKQLKRKPEEKLAWIEYLEYYPSGNLAQNSVTQLNKLGNFDYNNYVLGHRTITLKKISFEKFTSNINFDSTLSLDLLAKVLEKNKKLEIHIISYQEKNILLAKQKAKSIKNYILKKYPNIKANRLNLSWFDQPKIIKRSKNKFELGEFIDFITVVKNT